MLKELEKQNEDNFMPGMKKIKETMLKQAIPEKIMEQFDFTEAKGYHPEPVLALIEKMDELLTKEQCLAIMEEQGCCKYVCRPCKKN